MLVAEKGGDFILVRLEVGAYEPVFGHEQIDDRLEESANGFYLFGADPSFVEYVDQVAIVVQELQDKVVVLYLEKVLPEQFQEVCKLLASHETVVYETLNEAIGYIKISQYIQEGSHKLHMRKDKRRKVLISRLFFVKVRLG